MKNKIVIIVLIILGATLTALIGIYFIKQNKSSINSPKNIENTTQESQDIQSADPASESSAKEGIENSTGESSQVPTEQLQDKLITDDFEIVLPIGWKKTAPPMGASAMAVNVNEQLNDPAAQKINFRTYFAVSYDTTQGKSLSEYTQIVKSRLRQTIAGVVFAQEHDTTINGKSARSFEANLTQQGVNFKILMVAVKGAGDDVWVISFNTLQSSWAEYQKTFSEIANSFKLKLRN